MERLVKNGVLRLPPGFRFHPTDEELVLHYLKRKVMRIPLPTSIISEFDVCKTDPWDVPGEGEQERYFFTATEAKYPKGRRVNRAAASGYWKATGLDKQIVSSRSNHVVGMKKTLVFYGGKPPKGRRTDWIMHEYRLPNAGHHAAKENWVLCRVFLKKRKSRDENGQPQNLPVFYNFMAKEASRAVDLNLLPASSSSGSSGITAVSTSPRNEEAADADQEEESSSCNSFFPLQN